MAYQLTDDNFIADPVSQGISVATAIAFGLRVFHQRQISGMEVEQPVDVAQRAETLV